MTRGPYGAGAEGGEALAGGLEVGVLAGLFDIGGVVVAGGVKAAPGVDAGEVLAVPGGEEDGGEGATLDTDLDAARTEVQE